MGTYTHRDTDTSHQTWADSRVGAGFAVFLFAAGAAVATAYAGCHTNEDATSTCQDACEYMGSHGQRFQGSCLCENGVRPFAW